MVTFKSKLNSSAVWVKDGRNFRREVDGVPAEIYLTRKGCWYILRHQMAGGEENYWILNTGLEQVLDKAEQILGVSV